MQSKISTSIRPAFDFTEDMRKHYEAHLNSVLFFQKRRRFLVWKRNIPTNLKAFTKNGKYRFNVLKELLSTEKGYIKDITLIFENVQKPLVEKQIINSKELENSVFSNLEEIIKFNTNSFYQPLFQKVKDFTGYRHDIEVMAEVKDKIPNFSCYYEYNKNYNQIEKSLEKLKNQNGYASFF